MIHSKCGICYMFCIFLMCFQTFVQKPSAHLDDIQAKIKERHAELLVMDKVIYHKNVKVRRSENNCRINYKSIISRRTRVRTLSTTSIRE